MQSLDARLKHLEAQALKSHKPGAAARIHAWFIAHGIEAPPPDHPDMLLTDYARQLPTDSLKAIVGAYRATRSSA